MRKPIVKANQEKKSPKKGSILTEEFNTFTENVIDTVREPLLVIDQDLRIIKANRSFYEFFKVRAEETIGKLIYELGNHQWDIPKLKELLEEIIPEKNSFDNYEVEHNFSTIGKRVMLLNARQVKRALGKEKIILLAIEDITERKRKEESLEKTNLATSDFLNSLLNHMHAPMIIWDNSMIIKRFNHQFERMSGYDSAEVIDKKIDILFPKEKIATTLELLKYHLEDEHEADEIDILTKDNKIKTVLWNSSRILDEDGKNIIATFSQDITKRKLTEEALNLSENRYRQLFESAKDGILILDAQTGKIVDVNPFLIDLLGYSKTDFIEKSIWEIDSFKDIYESKEKFLELQQEEYIRYDDLPLVTSDGREIHVEFVSNVYLANNTKVIQCNIRDITERKQTQQHIKDSEKRFRAIFDQAPFAIALIDTQGHILFSNVKLSEMIGYSLDELAGMKFTDITYPEDIDKDMKSFTDLTKEEIHSYTLEKRYVHKNGAIVWVNISISLLCDVSGTQIEILAMAEDITERKKSENKLKESEFLLTEAMKIAGLGAWEYDVASDRFTFNDQFYRLLRTNAEKEGGYIMSSSIYAQKFVHPDDISVIGAEINNALMATDPNYYSRLDHRIIYADGNIGYITVHIRIKKDMHGRTVKTYGVNQEITERKQMEIDLVAAKEKAEESDHLKTSFLHNISHEIRTPLNAIVGFSGLLNDPGLMPEKRNYYIDIILQSSDQLLAIIDDIVSIACIEAGQVKKHEGQVNINEICKLINDQFLDKSTAKDVKLSFKTSLPDEEAMLITDATKLTQIISNLISNAYKFTPQGYINFGYKVKDGQLEFYVEDSGIGIAFDMQEKIFNRFRQVETTDTRSFGGSGLGLSISKAYVEMLGGKMWLTSELGKGAVFYFTIPYKKVNPDKSPDIPSIKDLHVENKTLKTLLIAEDEDSNFMLLKEMLSDTGINIIRAKNGLEAVNLCHANPHINMVLMDIKMPDMDGYEATLKIKEFRPDLYIIAQTAYITEADRNKTLACGCSDFISKPINKELLLYKMKEQLYT